MPSSYFINILKTSLSIPPFCLNMLKIFLIFLTKNMDNLTEGADNEAENKMRHYKIKFSATSFTKPIESLYRRETSDTVESIVDVPSPI